MTAAFRHGRERVAREDVLAAATRYAGEHKWRAISTPGAVVLYPAEGCEPIHLAFNGTALAKDFVKTQFAGAAVHRDVAGLFRRLKPLMTQEYTGSGPSAPRAGVRDCQGRR